MHIGAQLRIYLDLAFLKAKPQDLPAGKAALWLALVVALVSSVLVESSIVGAERALQRALLNILISSGFLWGAVAFRRMPERFTQAYAALCGGSGVFNLAAWPILYGLANNPNPDFAQALSLLIFYAWTLCFWTHVYRHTLNLRVGVAFSVALSYFLWAFFLNWVVFAPADSL